KSGSNIPRLFHRLCHGGQIECRTPSSIVNFFVAFQLSCRNQSKDVATQGVIGFPPSSEYSLNLPRMAFAIATPVVSGRPVSRKRNRPFSFVVAGAVAVVN